MNVSCKYHRLKHRLGLTQTRRLQRGSSEDSSRGLSK